MGVSDKVSVENIKDEDLDEIVRMGLSTKELWVEEGKPGYYEKEQLVPFIKSSDDVHLVARVNGEIAGYFLITFNPFLKEAYLIDIVIKEKYRSQGIGKILFQKAMQELEKRNCGWMWALVHEGNEKMINFMEKQKFARGRKFFFYYKSKQH